MKKIVDLLKNIKSDNEKLNLIENYKEYLKNGTYKIDSSGTRIYLEDTEFTKITTFESNKKLSLKKKTAIKLINLLNKKNDFVVINSLQKKFMGEVLLFGTSNKEVKIFNLYDKEMLTLFQDGDRYKKIIEKRKHISNIFLTPNILEDKYQTIKEEIIETEEFDNLNVVKEIIDTYIEKANIMKREDIDIINMKINQEEFFRKIYEKYVHKFQSNTKFIISHGDLWSANVLYNNKRIYVIDYEAVGVYSYLYDFFVYIYNAYNINGEDFLINYFFDGYFDKQLERFANALEIEFYKEKKKQYFMFFIYEFATHRFINYNSKEMKKEIKHIKQIMDKFKL